MYFIPAGTPARLESGEAVVVFGPSASCPDYVYVRLQGDSAPRLVPIASLR